MTFLQIVKKHKDVLLYLFFGVCTTAVNIVIYWFMAHIAQTDVMFGTAIAWLCAVLFAYTTNRKFVFQSNARTKQELLRELLSFILCRVATGLVDSACMLVFVKFLQMNDVLIKFGANILVIILNYIASKWMIFKK